MVVKLISDSGMAIIKFIKNNGVKFGVTAGLVYGILVAPHTFGIQQYKSFITVTENGQQGEPKKLTRELQNICDQLKSFDIDSSRLQFVYTYNQDPQHIGSTKARSGAVIGIPIQYRYSQVSDVSLEKVRYMGKVMDLSSMEGHQYLESIILSKEAKKFAIMREIKYADTRWFHVRGLLATIAAFYAVIQMNVRNIFLYTKLQPHKVQAHTIQKYRKLTLVLIACTTYALYILPWDLYNRYCDNYVDSETLKLGDDFVKGAQEFYSKQLTRNQALYHLTGYAGKKTYKEDGNFTRGYLHTCWSQVPVTKRLNKVHEYINKTSMK